MCFKSSVVRYVRVFQFVIEITYVIHKAIVKCSKEILFSEQIIKFCGAKSH